MGDIAQNYRTFHMLVGVTIFKNLVKSTINPLFVPNAIYQQSMR
ncbi:hypothetical protein CLNEO_26450 [Anaerotignum neopropionicum]|uniref:Uncharacterized protein n=1 Tax=Anaerotignum neopropionicum TaxID=36847 RepID=A0A136WBX4_9FIRM|nr:hypothetical protein CLNEO_26450 [Anaerotignum neopropionicum]